MPEKNILMKNFNNALEAIYDHVRFKEDWVVYPIDDRINMYWVIIDDEKVTYHQDKEEVINQKGNEFSNEIYKQRFYPKWVYRGEDLTLILVDTRTDGNKFFAIYDNKKEIKQNEIKEFY